MTRDELLFFAGVGVGVAVALVLTDALLEARRAHVEQFQARREAFDAELAWLERVVELATANKPAAA